MVAIGNRLILGYNVHFGLKSETDISDVFAVYSFNEEEKTLSSVQPFSTILSAEPVQASPFANVAVSTLPMQSSGGASGSPGFERDFKDLFRYYKNAVFAKF